MTFCPAQWSCGSASKIRSGVSLPGTALRKYGLPFLEWTELFARGIGSTTELVQKEMYSLPDSKGRSITLRPEGTAPVIRSYIEHHLDRAASVSRLYYIGPMFRHERPQKGRYRQFSPAGD